MAEARQSMEPQHGSLVETTWEELTQPGAYVEEETGDLFRVPQDALVRASPIITKVSYDESLLLRVSDDPSVPLLTARMIAEDHNIAPNF
jgi:hypothetical protein